MGKYNFTDTMDRAKIAAQRNRNRGQHTGKVAKGWTAKPHAKLELGTYERLRQSVWFAWDCHSSLAIEDYCRAVYPERYDLDAMTLGAWS